MAAVSFSLNLLAWKHQEGALVQRELSAKLTEGLIATLVQPRTLYFMGSCLNNPSVTAYAVSQSLPLLRGGFGTAVFVLSG